MTAQEYIQQRLEHLPLSLEPPKVNVSLEEAVYSRLMSKKFRKMKAGEPCVEITKRVVAKAVKEQTPIMVTQCFGGNKLWRFDEAPEVDWAELFSLFYFIDWMKYVAAVHKPGMIFDYFSQDISAERLNNLTKDELDAYSQTFRDIIAFVEPYLPKGVTLQYRRHRGMFDNQLTYDEELKLAMDGILDDSNGRLPDMTEIQKIATELNVRLKPGQNEDPKWREKVELQHQAIFKTLTFKKYADYPDMIWTCPTYFDDSIVTGSTKRSLAKFWAAVGALQRDDNSYKELVLTPKQLAKTTFKWEDVQIVGLKGKNFKRIRVIS